MKNIFSSHEHKKKYIKVEYGLEVFEGYWICECGKSGIDKTNDWKSLEITEEEAVEIMRNGRLI